MKKKGYIFSGLLFAFLAFGLTYSNIFAKETETTQRVEALTKFTKVVNIVEKYYVDDENIAQVIDKAIEGLMTNLDAHSAFLKEKEFKDLKIQTSGEFGGLGITVGIRDGALTVIAPIEGTPADKAGIKAGDIILKIDEKSTLNMTIDEAVGLMRGKPGTKIDLTVVRKNETKPLSFSIKRDIITIESVYTKKIENNDGVLYVRVVSFDQNVVEEVKKALKKEQNIKGIVLDLRNNPGGLLDQAVGLVDLFIESGIIVSQKGRVASEDRDFTATKVGSYINIPMAVLVNEGSASASEIVSGSLQDHKRAIVVGEKTFGKGSVQIILPINKDEALRLTVAKYYLPSGRTIQAIGVTPDIEIPSGKVPTEESNFSIKEADLKKHLTNELAKINGDEKSLQKDENKSVVTTQNIMDDIQLKSALDTLKTWEILKNRK